jgi:hypothetical protein
MKVGASLSRLLAAAGPTFRRFWVPTLLTTAMTTALIMSIDGDSDSRQRLIRAALSFAAGLLASWCSILFWEREPRNTAEMDHQLPANLIALLAAGVVTALTYAMLAEFTLVSMSRHAAICLFLFLSFFVVPHFRKDGSLDMYVVRLFAHAVVSALFSAVMFFGLSAITFTVSSLFSLNVHFETYIRIWLAMAGVLAPFLFMAGIPLGTVSESTEDYPKVLRNLELFVVAPLLTAYTGILYLYFAKILITREWPVGLVAHLVLWYSLVGTALLLFLWPVGSENRWGETFTKYFPKAVLPLLLMMFASVGIRIRHYGITENRYYVTIMGLWVFGCMVYLMLSSKRRSVVLPASLAIVIALTVVGPWSSFSVSKWSQNRRLEGLLVKHGMLQGKSIVPAPDNVPQADKHEMAQILFYFDANHSLSDVRSLPQGFVMDDFRTVFGFYPYDTGPVKPRPSIWYEAKSQAMDIEGYRYLFDYTKMDYSEGSLATQSLGEVSVTYNRDTHGVSVSLNGTAEWETSLLEHFRTLAPAALTTDERTGRANVDPEDMVIADESANLRIRIVITALWGELPNPEAEGGRIHQANFYLLVGEK